MSEANSHHAPLFLKKTCTGTDPWGSFLPSFKGWKKRFPQRPCLTVSLPCCCLSCLSLLELGTTGPGAGKGGLKIAVCLDNWSVSSRFTHSHIYIFILKSTIWQTLSIVLEREMRTNMVRSFPEDTTDQWGIQTRKQAIMRKCESCIDQCRVEAPWQTRGHESFLD